MGPAAAIRTPAALNAAAHKAATQHVYERFRAGKGMVVAGVAFLGCGDVLGELPGRNDAVVAAGARAEYLEMIDFDDR